LICVAYRPESGAQSRKVRRTGPLEAAGQAPLESDGQAAARKSRPYNWRRPKSLISLRLRCSLSEADSLALLDSHLPTAPGMPGRLKELLLKNAQGNPLFIVEMTRALIENYMSYDAASASIVRGPI